MAELNNYQGQNQYSTNPYGGGRLPQGVGNAMMMLFGNKIWPLATPGTPQSQFDALWQRQHDLQMLQVGRNAVANWFPIKNLGGINTSNPFSQILTSLAGQPDSFASKMMSPVLGGNPVLAQMSTFANMQGINMAGLGTLRGMSMGQISDARDIFEQNFYNHGKRDPGAISGIYKSRHDQMITSLAGTGASTDGMFGADNRVNVGSDAYKSLANKKDDLDKVEEILKNYNKDTSKTGDVVAAINKLQFDGGADFKKKIVDAVKEGSNQAQKEGGQKWAETFATAVNKKSIDEAARIASLPAVATDITRGVNYNNTRGFKYEDLFGAMNEAIKTRLTNGEKYSTLTKAFSGGQGSTVAALDAARGYFGNDLSGKELVDKLSGFVGFSDVDLANPGKLEDRLRSVKATARVSNIDFEQLRGMIDQTTGLASGGPATSKLGGMETSTILENAALNTAAISSGMDSQSVRWMGGTAGMVASRAQGAIQSGNDRISSMLAAMYHQGDAATKARISSYSKTGDVTAAGFSQFLSTMPGGATAAFNYADNNKMATSLGFQESPELMEVGGRSRVASAFQQLGVRYGGGAKGKAMIDRARNLLASGHLNEFLADKYTNVGEFGDIWQDLASKGFLDQTMLALNPNMRAQRGQIQKDKDESANFDKQVSKIMGHMNAGVTEQLVQSVVSGDVSKNGISSMLKAIGVEDNGNLYAKALGDSTSIKNMDSATTLDSLLTSAGVDDASRSKLTGVAAMAGKYNISAGQLRNLGQGANFDDVFGKNSGITREDRGSIQTMANAFAKNTDMTGYSGDFDIDSMREFYKNKKIDDVIDTASAPALAMYTPQMKADLAKRKGDASDSIIDALNSVTQGNTDLAYKSLDTLQAEDSITGSDANGFTIGGEHGKIMGKMGKGLSYKNRADAEAAVTGFDDAIKRTDAYHDSIGKASLESDIAKRKEDSHDSGQSIPKILEQILKKIDGLGALSTAVQNVANAVKS